MAWNSPQPTPQAQDREKLNFSREIWTRVRFGSFTMAPVAVPSLNAATYVISQAGGDVTTSVVVGLRVGMPVNVSWPSAPPAGITMDCWCDTKDALKVRFQNFSGAPVTPPTGAYGFSGMVI